MTQLEFVINSFSTLRVSFLRQSYFIKHSTSVYPRQAISWNSLSASTPDKPFCETEWQNLMGTSHFC